MAKKDRKKGKTQQDPGTAEVQAPLQKNASLIDRIKSRTSEVKAEAQSMQKVQAQAQAKAKPQVPAPAPRPLPKKKTPAEKKQARIDGIKKTVYSSLLGVLAGFVCYFLMGMGTTTTVPWHFVLIVLVLVTYYIQKFTYPLLGIDSGAFGGKDWFYVEFLVIDLWLVTWTLLLN